MEALALAKLPAPRNRAELAVCFLHLLVEGIDHDLTGEMVWYQCIEGQAPKDPTRRRVQ